MSSAAVSPIPNEICGLPRTAVPPVKRKVIAQGVPIRARFTKVRPNINLPAVKASKETELPTAESKSPSETTVQDVNTKTEESSMPKPSVLPKRAPTISNVIRSRFNKPKPNISLLPIRSSKASDSALEKENLSAEKDAIDKSSPKDVKDVLCSPVKPNVSQDLHIEDNNQEVEKNECAEQEAEDTAQIVSLDDMVNNMLSEPVTQMTDERPVSPEPEAATVERSESNTNFPIEPVVPGPSFFSTKSSEYPTLRSILNAPKKKSAARKTYERKKRLANFSDNPSRSEMKMADLIHWKPNTSPMKRENPTVNPLQDSLPSIAAPEERDESGLNPAAPKVIIDENGEIILDESSLVVRRKETLEFSEAVVENENTTYSSFRNRLSKQWTMKETEKFYKSLCLVGTDFALMESMFYVDNKVTRTRRELKLKFKREEKLRPDCIHKAMYETQNTFDEKMLQEEEEEDVTAEIIEPPKRGRKRNVSGKKTSSEPMLENDATPSESADSPPKKKRKHNAPAKNQNTSSESTLETDGVLPKNIDSLSKKNLENNVPGKNRNISSESALENDETLSENTDSPSKENHEKTASDKVLNDSVNDMPVKAVPSKAKKLISQKKTKGNLSNSQKKSKKGKRKSNEDDMYEYEVAEIVMSAGKKKQTTKRKKYKILSEEYCGDGMDSEDGDWLAEAHGLHLQPKNPTDSSDAFNESHRVPWTEPDFSRSGRLRKIRQMPDFVSDLSDENVSDIEYLSNDEGEANGDSCHTHDENGLVVDPRAEGAPTVLIADCFGRGVPAESVQDVICVPEDFVPDPLTMVAQDVVAFVECEPPDDVVVKQEPVPEPRPTPEQLAIGNLLKLPEASRDEGGGSADLLTDAEISEVVTTDQPVRRGRKKLMPNVRSVRPTAKPANLSTPSFAAFTPTEEEPKNPSKRVGRHSKSPIRRDETPSSFVENKKTYSRNSTVCYETSDCSEQTAPETPLSQRLSMQVADFTPERLSAPPSDRQPTSLQTSLRTCGEGERTIPMTPNTHIAPPEPPMVIFTKSPNNENILHLFMVKNS